MEAGLRSAESWVGVGIALGLDLGLTAVPWWRESHHISHVEVGMIGGVPDRFIGGLVRIATFPPKP